MHPILLYDGVCGLCNRLVQFILRRDPGGVFRFAALQSEFAGRVLARHGVDAHDLDTVYVVVNYGLGDEQLLARSDAIIFVLKHLGPAARVGTGDSPIPVERSSATPSQTLPAGRGFWPFAGFLIQLFPRPLRDWKYRLVARHRYRIFGRFDTCMLPSEQNRSRFLDV